jgi:hypothetical protein
LQYKKILNTSAIFKTDLSDAAGFDLTTFGTDTKTMSRLMQEPAAATSAAA